MLNFIPFFYLRISTMCSAADLVRDGGFAPGNASPLFQCSIAELLEANADG